MSTVELLYAWINNYRSGLLNKQGLNFSGKYRFEYSEISGELKVYKNANHLDDFFRINNSRDYARKTCEFRRISS